MINFYKGLWERSSFSNSRKRPKNININVSNKNSDNFVRQQAIKAKIIKQTAEEFEDKVQKMEIYIEDLNNRTKSLKCDQAKINNKKDYKELSEIIEKTYSKYSTLSKKTLKQKELENKAFENFISVSQDKEKALVDIHLTISHQNTKIKLLNEILEKKNKEYNIALDKNTHIVIFNMIKGICNNGL